jgi:hypothetical protein
VVHVVVVVKVVVVVVVVEVVVVVVLNEPAVAGHGLNGTCTVSEFGYINCCTSPPIHSRSNYKTL